MTTIREYLRRRFAPIQPLAAGVYHYISPPDDPRNYRLHLRLEADGNGILIVNAATVLHLNQTAAEYAYHFVQQTPGEQIVRSMSERYRVRREQALQDYRDFAERLDTLINTHDLDPVEFLGFDRRLPYAGDISAPYRLDCALTYRLPPTADPSSAPTKRVTRELTTPELECILDKAWQGGIPHVVFTGGEPTLRDDLPLLIAHAEANGQVSGLLTDGARLADAAYLDTLLQTGLDHLLIVLQPENEQIWKGLQNALAADIFVAVHFTLTPQNSSGAAALLERLAEMGVKAISLSAVDATLRNTLSNLRDHAAALQLSLIWDLPVPYSALHPVALEVEDAERAEGAGRAWLYVEPDGDVLPAQGVNQVLGNLLSETWESLWKKAN